MYTIVPYGVRWYRTQVLAIGIINVINRIKLYIILLGNKARVIWVLLRQGASFFLFFLTENVQGGAEGHCL